MKVVVISDTHFPYHNKAAYKEVLRLIKQERPDAVIQIGDLLDQYVFSKYSRSQNLTTPEREVSQGRMHSQSMWATIRKLVPKAKLYQVLGNHDLRLKKRIMEVLPELETVYNYKDMYTFPGVKTLKNDRDYIEIDGVVYCHGWLSKSIDHAKHFAKPTVHGHRHKPAIETAGRLWSMDVGFLGDEKRVPFNYTMSKLTNWRMAIGIVDNGKPRLVLL